MNGYWYLCDPDLDFKNMIRQEIKWKEKFMKINLESKKSFDILDSDTNVSFDYYFMTNPEEFIYDHFPIEPEYQLLARNVKEDEFWKLPFLHPSFFNLKLKLLTHPSTFFTTFKSKNEILIGTNKDIPVNFSRKLYLEDEDEDILENTDAYCIMFQDPTKNQLIIRLRLPKKGTYLLSVGVKRGEIWNTDYIWCCTYRIQFDGEPNSYVKQFPRTYIHELGSTNFTCENRFKITTNYLGMDYYESNQIKIDFKGKNEIYDLYPVIYHEGVELIYPHHFCLQYFEKERGSLIIYFPYSGEYTLNLHIYQYGKNIRKCKKCPVYCNCIDKNSKYAKPPFCYVIGYIFIFKENFTIISNFKSNFHEKIGIQKNFSKFGLEFKAKLFPYQNCSSTFNFLIFKTKPCLFNYELFRIENNFIQDKTYYSFYENSKNYCKFFIKFPKIGFYNFIVYAKQPNSDEGFSKVYTCYLNVTDVEENQLNYFPLMFNTWQNIEGCRINEPLKRISEIEHTDFEINGLDDESLSALEIRGDNSKKKFKRDENSWKTTLQLGISKEFWIRGNWKEKIPYPHTDFLKYTQDELPYIDQRRAIALNKQTRQVKKNNENRKKSKKNEFLPNFYKILNKNRKAQNFFKKSRFLEINSDEESEVKKILN